MTRAAAPHLIASGSGRVINQASTAAYNFNYGAPSGDYPGLSSFSYAQSKRGVVGLTKFCAGQLGRWNVTVNCIAPGMTHTAALDSLPEEQKARLMAEQPISGAIKPEDLTGTVVYFASEESHFVTGQTVVVDGGRFMPA
jgi:3-oxoacyl-[acyl-carrier protein] reductase